MAATLVNEDAYRPGERYCPTGGGYCLVGASTGLGECCPTDVGSPTVAPE